MKKIILFFTMALMSAISASAQNVEMQMVDGLTGIVAAVAHHAVAAGESVRRRNIFPCGRLDKNTTGLMLLTDDGLAPAPGAKPALRFAFTASSSMFAEYMSSAIGFSQ